MRDNAIMTVRIFSRQQAIDVDVPLDITANDFVIALNEAVVDRIKRTKNIQSGKIKNRPK